MGMDGPGPGSSSRSNASLTHGHNGIRDKEKSKKLDPYWSSTLLDTPKFRSCTCFIRKRYLSFFFLFLYELEKERKRLVHGVIKRFDNPGNLLCSFAFDGYHPWGG